MESARLASIFVGLLFSPYLLANVDLGEYSVEDFARLPNIQDVDLSRGGTYLSAVYSTKDGTPTLLIQHLGDPDVPAYPVQTGDWKFNWTRWISDHELLVSVNAPTRIRSTPVVVTRLLAVDAKKSEAWLVFRRAKGPGFLQIQDGYIGTVAGMDSHFLIQGSAEDVSSPAVKLASITARKLPRMTVQKPARNILDWTADKAGNVRIGSGVSGDQESAVLKLKSSDGDWHDYSHLHRQDCQPMALPVHQPDIVYVQCPTDSGFGEVRELNITTGEWGELVASHPYSDVSDVALNRAGTEIDAIYYENELVPTEYRHPTLKMLKSLADKNFTETVNVVRDWSDDYGMAIIASYSDSLPWHYYLYNGRKKRLDYFTASFPEMIDKAPGLIHRVEYQARDGLTIPAFVTLPKELDLATAKNLPFVVHPHGGPHARDFYGYDWITQMLTAAGYGVLQMNFRGSTGYGMDFQKAGQKQWGQAMQDDITDGTHWLIEQSLADPERICIFGGSYGGYAALMGAVKEPELYRCTASLNGVTDLPDLLRLQRRYVAGKYATRHIGKLWRDRKTLRENSPQDRAEEIVIPVLLVHGEKDRVVEVRQSRRMARALRDEVLWRYVELPEGTHSLESQENRIAFATVLLEFFDAHLH